MGIGRVVRGRKELVKVRLHDGELDHILQRPSVITRLSLA